MGGGLALLFVVWLYTANNVIYNVTFMGGDSSQTLLTLVLAFVAEFAVGAALSVVVFRMLRSRK